MYRFYGAARVRDRWQHKSLNKNASIYHIVDASFLNPILGQEKLEQVLAANGTAKKVAMILLPSLQQNDPMVRAHRKSHRISCLLGNQIPKQNKQAVFILAQGNPHKLYFIQLILLPPIQCSSLGLLLFRLSSKTPKQKYPNLLN